MDVLIDHALNGFVGPTYTQMPARGANPDLTDDEVTLAVAFMVWSSGGADLVQAYLSNTKGTGQ
jgi:cytochrome c5